MLLNCHNDTDYCCDAKYWEVWELTVWTSIGYVSRLWQYHRCITQHRPPRYVSFVDWRVEGTSFIPFHSKGTDIVYLLCRREWQQDPHASCAVDMRYSIEVCWSNTYALMLECWSDTREYCHQVQRRRIKIKMKIDSSYHRLRMMSSLSGVELQLTYDMCHVEC